MIKRSIIVFGSISCLLLSIGAFNDGSWVVGLILVGLGIAGLIPERRSEPRTSKSHRPRVAKPSSLRPIIGKSDYGSVDATPELDLSETQFLPLPPSPPYWELRQEEDAEFHSAYANPKAREIITAYWEKRYAATVKRFNEYSEVQADPYVRQTVAKAYRQLIQQHRKRNWLKKAAEVSTEFLSKLHDVVNQTDQNRHNRILDELEAQEKVHSFKHIEPTTVTKKDEPLFSVTGEWALGEIAKLGKDEKSSDSLKEFHLFADGLLAMGVTESGVALLQYVAKDGTTVRRELDHDIYRIGIGPDRRYLCVLSAGATLFLYDNELKLLMQKELSSIGSKAEIRCVQPSPGGRSFLYTAQDHLVVCSLDGSEVLKLRLPPKDGWERITEQQEARNNTSGDVRNALALMGLSLPASASEIKTRYRELALQWHPDRNNGSQAMVEKMQALNTAYSTLTGTDPSELLREVTGGTVERYEQKLWESKVEAGGMEFTISASMVGPGADWIYAASFSADGGRLFVGAYSGKVIEVDLSGKARRIFGLGNTPRLIVDVGDSLYFLTSTRLYVLNGESLAGLVDVFRKGQVLWGTAGFGLRDDKTLRWFRGDKEVASLSTKHPIRSLFLSGDNDLVVQTRQHEARVAGIRNPA